MSNSITAMHTAALVSAMQTDGAAGVIDYIRSRPESEHYNLYTLAQSTFGTRGNTAVPLDDYITIVRAGIDDSLRRSSLQTDPAAAASLKDAANIASFNLLADLAECWPDDHVTRERRHFEEGLRAAEDCIRWRDELGKPNNRKAMPWWGKGMHLLSLERYAEAIAAFETTCRLVFGGESREINADATFDQLLYSGYLALARIAAGDASGETLLSAVRLTLDTQLLDESRREDAQFALDQLGVVEGKIRAGVERE